MAGSGWRLRPNQQRQLDNLALLRQASEVATMEAGDTGSQPETLATDMAALAPSQPKSRYSMGETATREWMSLAQAEFEALREARRGTRTPVGKMVNTIVALVDARLAGQPETPVFGRPDTCSRNTYHGKWKQDPAFATCLDNVTQLARHWKDGRALRTLEEAAEKLRLASPGAAAKLADAMVHAGDWNVMVRAAIAILDRADVKTAAKGGFEVDAQVSRRAVVNLADLDPAAAAAFLANARVLQEADEEADATHPMDDAGPD